MDITAEQEIEFKQSTRCSICNKQFDKGDTKVRDHCHFSGKYRGAAHEKCNLDYCFKHFKVPVFFHNLKNYDAHLIIEKANELNKELNPNKRIKVIAQIQKSLSPFLLDAVSSKTVLLFYPLH